jgi:hypothetical protein
MKGGACLGFLLAARLLGVQIPAGSELSIRLTDKAASEAQAQPPGIHAVLIAPVILNGTVAVAAGVQLTGSVKQAKAATDRIRPSCNLSLLRSATARLGRPFRP